jgi:hypothetical protein
MQKTLYADKLHFDSLGYSAAPTPATDPDLSKDVDARLWLRFQGILEQAKAGSFKDMPTVLDLYEEAKSAMFRFVCSRLLGDAGTGACFSRTVKQLQAVKGSDPNLSIHHCSEFRAAGFLWAVPIMLEEYQVLRKSQETAIIPLYLSSMLETKWGRISRGVRPKGLPGYSRLVTDRYEKVKARFQTDRVIVYAKRQAGVIPYARMILKLLGNSAFEQTSQTFLRRRFEASTGIDCSAFYKKGEFQALEAASIVEGFLESPDAAKYEDGVRYFFGHRIPD